MNSEQEQTEKGPRGRPHVLSHYNHPSGGGHRSNPSSSSQPPVTAEEASKERAATPSATIITITRQSPAVPQPGSKPRAEESTDWTEDMAERVKKSTLNPNAKEFKPFKPLMPMSKPNTTPTPPRPTPPSPVVLQHPGGQASLDNAPDHSNVPQIHSVQAGLAKGDMTEIILTDASLPPCSLDVAIALQEDGTSVPQASLEIEMFEQTNHPNKILEGLNRLRLNGALCDVTLCCGGQEFPCHRYVLASFTSYFEVMFTSGMMESTQERVVVSGVDPEMIEVLVNYAYTSKVSISTANVQALLAASNLLDFPTVKEACCDYMERRMDINNCVGIYCFAEAHSCKMLEKHSMDYILEHFSVIYQQDEFLSLSVERLTEILASDHLNVPKEDMVFEAAMLWLGKDPTRRQSFEKVLEHIRLPLMSPSCLHDVIESLEVVKEYQGCQRFISEAKDQDLVPYCNTARPRRTTVLVMVGSSYIDDFRNIESFDPLTNRWMTLGRLPYELRGICLHAVVLSGSVLYLAGGNIPRLDYFSADVWRYDIPSKSWSKMAPMNEIRLRFYLVMLDGYVYAVGGEFCPESVERYDPSTDTWQLTKPVGMKPYSEHSAAVVVLDGLLYFIGGSSSSQAQMAKYNHKTSEWTELAPMQIPRRDPAACALNGKIYVIGGMNFRTKTVKGPFCITENTMECYCPKTNQWTMCAPMQVRRSRHGVAVVDGKMYVLGGQDGTQRTHPTFTRGFPRNIERYSEEMDMWETVGEMPAGHCDLHCMPLRLRNDHAPIVNEDEEDEHSETEDESEEDEYYYSSSS